MSSNDQSGPSTVAHSVSQLILHAEPVHFVGKYRVLANQVRPHPGQRLLCQQWVDSLHERFKDVGLDRAAHPIKVILENNNGLEALTAQSTEAGLGVLSELPNNIAVLVYHGQHRIAACLKLEDLNEHWWYAEVYRQDLETTYPAEFLTVMHSSNEEEYRLTTTDYDRFMVMYRLRQMREKETITEETYKANQERLERAVVKESTRQGLKNLLRSSILSNAVAQALQHVHLRPGFNAGTWGKKLTKGRFYRLVACLIEEMVEQCTLLRGDCLEVSPKPFQLTALSCEWHKLRSVVKKKDHPWQELPGGVSGALSRVSQRPVAFINVLNPKGTHGWTFKNTVLLPSVLTSELVVASLTEMYHIAQHFIHMVAGEDSLNIYTANRPQEKEEDHLVGIISNLLKTRLLNLQSNYPDKFVLKMWENRALLLQGLEDWGIEQATETTKEQYEKLILNHQPWWELLRMLKISKLDTGLGLMVPKVFGQPSSNTSSLREPPRSSQPPSSLAGRLTNPSITGENQNHPTDTTGYEVDTGVGENQAPSEVSPPQFHPHPDNAEMQSGLSQHTTTIDPGTPGRRRSIEEQLTSEDEEFYKPLTPPGSEDEVEVTDFASQRSLRCHRQVSQRLQQLESRVGSMRPEEARALGHFLEAIVDLQGTMHMVRVVEALSAKVKPFTQRAERANRVVQDFLLDQSEGVQEAEVQPNPIEDDLQ